MRNVVMALFVGGALGALGGCTPGTGEYGACTTPLSDCQINLQCEPIPGSVLPGDGGDYPRECRYSCSLDSDCSSYGEVCGTGIGFCSKDGGY